MHFLKKFIVIFLCVQLGILLHGQDLPADVVGVSHYDPFTHALPYESKGVYQVFNNIGKLKYVGSSLDINKRLAYHEKNGVLQKGDSVCAFIFYSETRQRTILDFERSLIKSRAPFLNKHAGTPGRPWRSEQVSKLHSFLEHNRNKLTPQGVGLVDALIAKEGASNGHNKKMATSLLRVMRLFR